VTGDIVQTADLDGAVESVDRAVAMLRELHSHGIAPDVSTMALASISDADSEDWRRVLARTSLMLAVSLARLAER
jgi:hypothetical protein